MRAGGRCLALPGVTPHCVSWELVGRALEAAVCEQ